MKPLQSNLDTLDPDILEDCQPVDSGEAANPPFPLLLLLHLLLFFPVNTFVPFFSSHLLPFEIHANLPLFHFLLHRSRSPHKQFCSPTFPTHRRHGVIPPPPP